MMMRYLLGDLSEEERDQLEREYIASDELFEQCLTTEDDLIDAYLDGELTPKQRDQFIRNFLTTPARGEKVNFARAWKQLVSEATATGGSTMPAPATRSSILMAASLVLVVLTAWLAIRSFRLQHDLAESRNLQKTMEQQRAMQDRALKSQESKIDELSREVAAERNQVADLRKNHPAPAGDRTIPSFDLTSKLVRSGKIQWQTMVVPSGAEVIRMRLKFDSGKFTQYRAILQSMDEEELWSQSRLSSRAEGEISSVSVLLPATTLRSGEYVWVLQGQNGSEVQDVAVFYFKLDRK